MNDFQTETRMVKRQVKSTVKQALRLLGHDVELASMLGVKTVGSDDTFIVSYPKSGNTWIRFLLANTLQSERIATFHDLDTYVPDLHKCKDKISKLSRPRFIKTHYAYCERFPRLLYICRDGRDVMVSFYHYQKQRGRATGTFAEFIRSRTTNIFGRWRWHEHVAAGLAEKRRRPDDVLFICYENLLDDPLNITKQIVEFCRIRTTELQIERAVERCSFGRLKKVEQTYGGAGELDSFMRRGTKDQWPEYFSDADLAYFHQQAGNVLQDLGYACSERPKLDKKVFP